MSLNADESRAFFDLPADERASFVQLATARNAVREARNRVSRAESELERARRDLDNVTKKFAEASDQALNKAKIAMTP